MNDRLYRSRGDRVIGGVCGGLATGLGLGPSIVRVGWVLLTFLTAYIPLTRQARVAGGTTVLVYAGAGTSGMLAALDAGPDPSRYHVHAFAHALIQRLTRARGGLVAGLLSSAYPEDPLRELERAGATEWWQAASPGGAALTNPSHQGGGRLAAGSGGEPHFFLALDLNHL